MATRQIMNTKIYILSDFDNRVRYIGKSIDPAKRYKKHLYESRQKRTHKEKWIYSLLERNQKPLMEIIEDVPMGLENDYEKYWIEQFRAWGFSLVNGTIGGDGSNGFEGMNHTVGTKEKISISRTGKKQSQEMKNKIMGIGNGNYKISDSDLTKIKELYAHGSSSRKVARIFNISKTAVLYYIGRKRRKAA
jgi:hypothetical protein